MPFSIENIFPFILYTVYHSVHTTHSVTVRKNISPDSLLFFIYTNTKISQSMKNTNKLNINARCDLKPNVIQINTNLATLMAD